MRDIRDILGNSTYEIFRILIYMEQVIRFLSSFLGLTTLHVITLSAAAEIRPTSVYTDLAGNACETIKEDKETGSTVRKCPGVGGFHLLVADDDARMSVSVVTPDNREHPLDYWNVITRSFSSLGKKAEWRVEKREGRIMPIALIVRVDSSQQEDLKAPRKTSYLAVAKITSEGICVTDKIGGGADANQQARRAADKSGRKVCLRP